MSQRVSQTAARWFFRILFLCFYRIRVHGLENYPDDDQLLVCANHQSFLDPLVLGVVCPRPVNYLARQSLFRFPPLARFLAWNDTIPIDLDSSGLKGMKETLRRLKRRETVIMFPEGTRTSDGEVQPFMLGFCTIATRAKATLVPIGFDGAFQAYPRSAKIPLPGTIHVVIGRPIAYDEYHQLSAQEVSDILEHRIRNCFEEARRRGLRTK